MTTLASHQSSVVNPRHPQRQSSGAPPEMLITRSRPGADQGWGSLVDELLRWRSSGESLFDADDRPSSVAIDAALDLIQFHRDSLPAPTSATPSGNRGIFLEWRRANGSSIVESIEFDASGAAEYVLIESGKVRQLIPSYDWRG